MSNPPDWDRDGDDMPRLVLEELEELEGRPSTPSSTTVEPPRSPVLEWDDSDDNMSLHDESDVNYTLTSQYDTNQREPDSPSGRSFDDRLAEINDLLESVRIALREPDRELRPGSFVDGVFISHSDMVTQPRILPSAPLIPSSSAVFGDYVVNHGIWDDGGEESYTTTLSSDSATPEWDTDGEALDCYDAVRPRRGRGSNALRLERFGLWMLALWFVFCPWLLLRTICAILWLWLWLCR